MHIPSIALISCGVAFVFLAVLGITYYYSTTYIGFGWMLVWKNGRVWVASRLIKSPSGYAGIQRGDQVLFWNGKKLYFKCVEDFDAWKETLEPLESGDMGHFEIMRQGKTLAVIMRASRVEKDIPIYNWDENEHSSWTPLLRYGLRTCPKTGETYTSAVLSDEALDC